MESWSIDPEELAFRGQRLSQREKGVKGSENNQHQGKFIPGIFFSDTFRCNEQDNPVREVLKCSIFGDVTVGRGAQPNLREKQHEKEQGCRVQRVSRQLHLPGNKLLSRPNKE